MKKIKNNLNKSIITYKDSGVDIDEGNKLIKNISEITETTSNEGSTGKLGGFGGLFDLKKCGFKDPILVSSTDGVGTKLQLAIKTKSYFICASPCRSNPCVSSVLNTSNAKSTA